MSTTQSNLLKVALIDSGTEAGQWGTITNDNFENVFEGAIAGTASIDVTSGDVTLTTTDGPNTNEARQMILDITGTPGTSRNVIAPSSSKVYVVLNGSDDDVVIKGAATTGVTIGTGIKAFVAWDGSDFVYIGEAGTVSTLSVVSANGFAGTVANATTTPAVTISTSVTGITKGDGTALSAATAGTDYVAPATATNFTAKQTFTGAATTLAAKFVNALELITVSATAATGTINYDVVTQSVLYYTTDATGNWTLNFRGDGSNSLDSLMSTGEVVTVTFLATQGATAYYNSAVQVDGGAVTPKWLGGSAPSAGNTSAIDAYTYAIIKTGAATFTVLASQSEYA
jgi:hypothetical protein